MKSTRYEDQALARINAGLKAMGWDRTDTVGVAECILLDLRHWCRLHHVSFREAVRDTREKFREEIRSDGPRPWRMITQDEPQ